MEEAKNSPVRISTSAVEAARPKRPRRNSDDVEANKTEESDSDQSSSNNPKPSTSSDSSSTSSSSSSSSSGKLADKMADKMTFKPSAEKRFKFEPNEDYLDQLIAMGISSNGAKKALFYTGNASVGLATNWIFDHPELDLETPLEDEMRRLEAEEDEDDEHAFDDDDDDDDDDEDSDLGYYHNEDDVELMCRLHNRNRLRAGMAKHALCHSASESAFLGDTDSESDSDDFDEDDIPDFKMVFVVNTSLNMGPGKVAAQVGHAALGVQRVLAAKSHTAFKVSLAELGLWQDFGEKMVVVKGESTQHLKDLQLMANDLELPSFMVKDAGITQVASGAVTIFGVFGEEQDVNKITGRLKLL